MALVVALMMVLAGVSALAAGHTISVQDTDTHEYKVFQVLTGTLSEAGSTQLGNAAWGADATDNAKAGDVKTFVDSLANKTDREIAQLVAAKVDTTTAGRGTVKKGTPLTDLATGYYVLVDVTTLTNTDGKSTETQALNVVKVVNDINGLQIKWDSTSVDKKITGDTLGTATPEATRAPDAEDTDNVSIGDTVFYTMDATVPVKATDYDYFFFYFEDKMDPGLTLNKADGDITVWAKNGSADEVKLDAAKYTIDTTATSSYTFRVALTDAKSYAGQKIIVKYSAILNENAKIGEESNDNTSKIVFSNNPNHDYTGDKDNNNPGFPDSNKTVPTGETPTDDTHTYTTAIEITKVDQDGKILTGAEFTITGDATEIVLVSNETFNVKDSGDYYGLKNGTYTTEAPVTADKMETKAGATAGYVEDSSYTGDDKVVIDSKTYRPYKPSEDTDKTVYILVKANNDEYDGKRYEKTVTYTQKNTKTAGVTATQEVGKDGVVRFVGLGAGTYTIKETKTPEGYNTVSDLKVTIEFTASPTGENPHWSRTTADDGGKFTYDKTDGVFKTEIENKKGSTLPSTGGIGTTIFYVAGSILVLAAAILLITKRRMGSED